MQNINTRIMSLELILDTYIEVQIVNMKAMVKTFEAGCKMAALKNDGTIDRNKEKQLKKINAASAKFIKELESIK